MYQQARGLIVVTALLAAVAACSAGENSSGSTGSTATSRPDPTRAPTPTVSVATNQPDPTDPTDPSVPVATSQPDVATSEPSVVDDQDLQADRMIADQAVLTTADLGFEWAEQPRSVDDDSEMDAILTSIVEAEPGCSTAVETAERSGVSVSDLDIAPQAPVRAESPTFLVEPNLSSEVEHTVSVYPSAEAAAASLDAVRSSEWLDCMSEVFDKMMQAAFDAAGSGLLVTDYRSSIESPDLADESLRGRFSLAIGAPDGSTTGLEFDLSAIRVGRVVSGVSQYYVQGEIPDPHAIVALAFLKVVTRFPDGGLGADSGVASASGEDHQVQLASRESPFIARRLVAVDGYSYVDADKMDIAYTVLTLEAGAADVGTDVVGAVTLHSVVADDPSQNRSRAGAGYWEVGFLRLYQLNDALSYGEDEQFARNSCPGGLVERLDIAGTTVFVFDDPSQPESRYHYCWLEQGVPGIIDGADREPIERWLRGYLGVTKLGERETSELAAQLPFIEGFAYVDVDTSAMPAEFKSLDNVTYSMHNVVNERGVFGSIILTDDQHEDVLEQILANFGLTAAGETEIGEHRIEAFDDSTGGSGSRFHAFIWTDAGLAGAFLTNQAALEPTERFLEALLRS